MYWKVPTIDDNVHCPCGYNLRGLTYDHACPECGREVLRSVRYSIELPYASDEDYIRIERALQDASDASGFSVHACRLVKCALLYAALQCGGREDTISAPELCRALRQYARLHCGGTSAAVYGLMSVSISSSRDVGEIARSLVAAGAVHAIHAKSKSDFDELFTLDNLFTAKL